MNLAVVIVAVDVVVLRRCLVCGCPHLYLEENTQRQPAPYVGFTGHPGVGHHNSLGFRGPGPDGAPTGAFVVAFFGGATGNAGQPPIPQVRQRLDVRRRVAAWQEELRRRGGQDVSCRGNSGDDVAEPTEQ